MIISETYRYAFVSTVKGGTNSLYQVLQSQFLGERLGEFHCLDVSTIPEDWFLFTTCRNPYERAISIWFSTCMRGKDRYDFRQMCPNPDSFEVFAEWACLMQSQLARMTEPQRQLLMTQAARHQGIRFDAILRVEQLTSDFARLPFVAGAVTELPKLNPTEDQRGACDQYLTPRAVNAVRRWMREDFLKYNYSLDLTGATRRSSAA